MSLQILEETPNLIKVKDERENEFWVSRKRLSQLTTSSRSGSDNTRFVKYVVDYERSQRSWVLGWTPATAWIVGFAAENNAYLRWSGQLDSDSIAEQADDEDFEVGTRSNGEKFDVVIPNPNYVGLDDALDINFIQGGGRRRVSLNKEGFWKFLRSIGFEAGKNKEQDTTRVALKVPEEFRDDFRAGMCGQILMQHLKETTLEQA